jgi:hypothetical protein
MAVVGLKITFLMCLCIMPGIRGMGLAEKVSRILHIELGKTE